MPGTGPGCSQERLGRGITGIGTIWGPARPEGVSRGVRVLVQESAGGGGVVEIDGLALGSAVCSSGVAGVRNLEVIHLTRRRDRRRVPEESGAQEASAPRG